MKKLHAVLLALTLAATCCATALADAGFLSRQEGGLLKLTPGPAWLEHVETAFPLPPDEFCRGFVPFRGVPPEPESLALFALGARCLDGDDAFARFDRHLRQRAAVCLRLNRAQPREPLRGGGLYACALLHHEWEV